jgi:hypothetical protein
MEEISIYKMLAGSLKAKDHLGFPDLGIIIIIRRRRRRRRR